MDGEGLRSFVDQSESIIDASPQMDEENTKVKVINPLIELLGWDIYSDEVELEYTIKIATTSTKVDYALILEENPVVFIEAKGLDTEINQEHREQLGSYMRQKGVDWGLLTNGRIFEVLKRKQDTDKPIETTLGKFELADLPDNPIALQLLTKDSIESGNSENIAANLEAKRRAITKLREQKNEIASELTLTITEAIGESINQEIEPQSKEFIDQVVQALEESMIQAGEGNDRKAPKLNPESQYIVRLTAGETTVTTFSDETQSVLMAEVASYLITEYDLLSHISVPYVPGKTKALIHEEAEHPDGSDMRNPYELPEGRVIETHDNSSGKQRSLEDLSGKCGLGVEFSGQW